MLEITPARIDLSGGTIAIRSLNTAHGAREAQASRRKSALPIWPLSRVRVWQIVKRIMIEAGLPDAPHRSPKGLRHGFGINATVNGVPLHMLQQLAWPRAAQQHGDLCRCGGPGRAGHRSKDVRVGEWKGG